MENRTIARCSNVNSFFFVFKNLTVFYDAQQSKKTSTQPILLAVFFCRVVLLTASTTICKSAFLYVFAREVHKAIKPLLMHTYKRHIYYCIDRCATTNVLF